MFLINLQKRYFRIYVVTRAFVSLLLVKRDIFQNFLHPDLHFEKMHVQSTFVLSFLLNPHFK